MDVDALLERSQWDTFWLPAWARVISTPELLYTVSERNQHALNMVLRVRLGPQLPKRVAEVSRAHQGVESRWVLARDSQLPGLPELLTAHGYHRGVVHNVRSVDTRRFTLATTPGITVHQVADEQTLTDCIRVCERAFGRGAAQLSSDRIANELATATGDSARVQRFVAYDSATGRPMGSGGLNLFPGLGLGFLWAGGVDPELRGRGAYRALVAARLARAAQKRCPVVAIYARLGTSDPIMEALGFERGGTLDTWDRSAEGPYREVTA